MKTTVERIDDTTVKLAVTVEAARVTEAMDAAARKLAQEVKVPGFRPGKVPRKVLETRLGKDSLRQEALQQALPAFYSEAVQAEQLSPVGQPEIDVGEFDEGKDAEFTATIEVVPEFEIPDLSEIQVPHPEWEATDEEVDEQLEELRQRFAELETVDRGADAGDHVVVSITGSRNGERVEQASGEDILYEVQDPQASESELDRALIGAEAGAIVTFSDTLGDDYGELSGQELEFSALLKEVKAKRLPGLDDDFAITTSEFDTIEELRQDVAKQLGTQKRAYARASLRGKVVEAVTEAVEVAVPKALVDQEVQFRVQRMMSEAQNHELTFEQYLEAVGVPAEKLVDQLEPDARATVKAQLVVDAFGREQGIEVDREDLGGEIMRQSARLGRPPEELAEFMTHPDRIGALLSDAFRRKAIDRLVDTVQVLSAPPPEEEFAEPEEEQADPEPTEQTGAPEAE